MDPSTGPKLLGFDVVAALLDLGETRLAAMDAAGIDVQFVVGGLQLSGFDDSQRDRSSDGSIHSISPSPKHFHPRQSRQRLTGCHSTPLAHNYSSS